MDEDPSVSGLVEVLGNSIFDRGGPRQLNSPNLTPLQKFQSKLFYEY